jgi:hypothetical protein
LKHLVTRRRKAFESFFISSIARSVHTLSSRSLQDDQATSDLDNGFETLPEVPLAFDGINALA